MGRGIASRRQVGGNGVVERFHESLKYEHLYQREIDNAAELAEELRSFLVSLNEIRPHEALRQRPPLTVHLAEPHLFRGRLSRLLDIGHRQPASTSSTEPGRVSPR
jgi:transposase InsO family protein